MRSKHDFPSLNSKDPEGKKPDGSFYKVMVVEDQEFHRRQIRQFLESEGYEVLAEAGNGEEALAMYDKIGSKLDLITTDLDMPILDGYALLFELNNRGNKAKVIFISEDTTKGVLQDLLQLGAADFILKPVQRLKVLERVRLALRK